MLGDRVWLGFASRTRENKNERKHERNDEPVFDAEALNSFKAELNRAMQQTDRGRKDSQHPKVPRLSRISSYMGIGGNGKQHSPPRHLVSLDRDDTSTNAHNNHSIRVSRLDSITSEGVFLDCDETWHKPNITQIMEMVACTIMSNGISEPIPRHFNGSICSMIEEFRVALGQVQKLRASFQELQQTRAQETCEFATVAEEWTMREAGFKSEIKRLEQIIASTEEGVAPVILARSGSVINRNDGKIFQAKLNRLSKTEDDELNYDKALQYFEREEVSDMRNFQTTNVTSTTDLDDGRMVLDHNTDVLLSGQIRELDAATQRLHIERNDIEQQKKMNQTNRFQNITGDPPPAADAAEQTSPRKSMSSNTTVSSTDASCTNSSGSLIAQGILAQRASQAQVTPHTTPPHPEPVKAHTTMGPVETVHELMKLNGGYLPEEAIDDSSSYACSVVPRQARAFSFKAGDDDASKNMDNNPGSSMTSVAKKGIVPRDAVSSLKLVDRPVTAFRPGEPTVTTETAEVQAADKIRSSSESSNSSGGSVSRSAYSSSDIMLSMGHNLMKGPRTSPSLTRKVQSGEEPVLDQATKDAARRERTIMSHMSTRQNRTSVLTAADVAAIDGMRLPLQDPNYEAVGDPVFYGPRQLQGRNPPTNGYRPAAGLNGVPRRFNGPLGPPPGFGPGAAVRRATTDIPQNQVAPAGGPAALSKSTSQPPTN